MDVKRTSACVSAHGQPITAFPGLNRGTSLMDVLTTLAVSSLVLGIAIPGFQNYLAYSQLISSTNLLAHSLALARSEAVKRNRHVVICKSRDQQTCTSTGSWRQGWIIFEDRTPDRQRDEEEALLFAKSELARAMHLDYRAFRSPHFIAFRPTGITKTNGSFTLCYRQDTDSARALILSKTGRVRLSRNRADGRALRCPE